MSGRGTANNERRCSSKNVMTMRFKEIISDLFAARPWKARSHADTLIGQRPEGASGKDFNGPTIKLLEASRPPATPVERLAVEILRREGRTSIRKLVEHVARELYSAEVRNGAWALDIGLYGTELFVPDAVSELKSGDGILWKIEEPGGERDGLLPDLS